MALPKISALLLLAASLAAQQYPVLPVAHSPRNVEHILQDRLGRIWISTHDDILCFDGERFFSLRDAGFPPVLGTLAEDDEGGILSATPIGVYRFFSGRLEHLLPGKFITEVIGVAPGILVAGVDLSLYRLRRVGNDWRAEPFYKSDAGLALTRDGNNNLLTPCQGGWCEFPAALVRGIGADPSGRILHPGRFDNTRVFRDRTGCLWFRSQEDVSYQCPGDRQPVSLPAAVASRNTWQTEEQTATGDMLFPSMASVSIGRPGSFQTLSAANGLPPEAVTCAIRASDGTIWIGSIGGLYRFPYPFRMTYWKSQFGLFSAFERLKGAIYAGTSAGIVRLNQGKWNALPGLRQAGSVNSLLAGRDNRMWAVVAGKSVLKLAPSGAIEARTPPGQAGVGETLARTADGAIWLAGDQIYSVIQRGRNLALISANSPVPVVDARIASDNNGALWACLAGSLLHRQGGIWESIALGLPAGRCHSLAFLPGGDVWAGYGTELALIRRSSAPGKSTVRIYPGGGETGNAVAFTLGVDARGWLWRGSQDGMYVAAPDQAQRGNWLRLNETDGLADLDINRGSFYAEADGSTWWGAAASVVHFVPPPDMVRPAAPPRVFVSAFSVDGAAPKWAELASELLSEKKLTVYLGSLDFERRNSLRVRYRVLPNDNRWRETSSLALDLGSLGWGRRTLEVQTKFSLGEWSQSSRRELNLLRPWWLSWPAILGLAGVFCGGALGGVTWLRRSKSRANANLPDLAPWRDSFLSPESDLARVTLDQRFRLDEPLARGGFASVFKGVDLHTGNACAIKVFRRDVLDENWLAHRFEQEVSALEQIRHPSVVSIYGHGVAPEGALYLAMEFIEGGTLRELLDAGPLPASRAASLLLQAACALETIHARGIYHRDLKPENLMLRAGGAPGEDLVLIDFSIAIVKEPDQTMHGLSRAAGTLYYMAPEQAMGFATPASDIFSLAKVLLEMLTGRRLTELLPNATLDLPQRVRELARTLPIRLSEESVELIGSALEFDPSRRPQEAAAFARPIARDLRAGSGNP